MISPDILTIPAAGQDLYGKTAGDMISDAFVDEDGNVTGTFHYISDYTAFSDRAEEQSGYYFPFKLSALGEKMTFKKNGTPVKENIPWEADNVFRVTKTDIFEVVVDESSVVAFHFDKAVFAAKVRSRKNA